MMSRSQSSKETDLSGIVASGKDEVTQDSTNENATQKHVTIAEDTISTKSLRCSNSRADRSLVSHNTTIGSSQANVRLSKDLAVALKCSICMQIFCDCVTTLPCVHSFCGSCLTQWFNTSHRKSCPTCRNKIDSVCRNLKVDEIVRTVVGKVDYKGRLQNEFTTNITVARPTNNQLINNSNTNNNVQSSHGSSPTEYSSLEEYSTFLDALASDYYDYTTFWSDNSNSSATLTAGVEEIILPIINRIATSEMPKLSDFRAPLSNDNDSLDRYEQAVLNWSLKLRNKYGRRQ